MSDAINRKTVRDAVAALFTPLLSGSGNIAQAIYGYKVGLIAESPTIVISSSSSQREIKTIDATVRWDSIFLLDVTDFVRDVIPGDPNWTEQNVEDTLDLVDKAIADIIAANHVFSVDGIGDVFMDLVNEPSEIFTDTQRGMVGETRMVSVECKE